MELRLIVVLTLTALRFRWDLVVFPGGGKVGAARHNPGESGG